MENFQFSSAGLQSYSIRSATENEQRAKIQNMFTRTQLHFNIDCNCRNMQCIFNIICINFNAQNISDVHITLNIKSI